MKSAQIYNQVFSNLEKGIPLKSREGVLREYFKNYLPSISATYEIEVLDFLQGNISYEQMLDVISTGISLQKEKQLNKIPDFDRSNQRVYGSRSIVPIPSFLTHVPLEKEINRFKEVFGKERQLSVVRVPGTRELRNNTMERVASLGAW